ncbi:MAG TPA: hypothetical protein EYP92_04140 [Candidatus Thioglobus sp.]|jgi:hypothetical protein|nr:hypothetical protein [Candidatus Thioglobus sp.]
MADFIASPNVGDEITKGRNRYRFDGVGWTSVHRSTYREGTLITTKELWQFKTTATQTVISGSDLESNLLNYDTSAEIDVYINGIKVKVTDDYVLTSSSVITLTSAAALNDEIEISQRAKFADTDVYTKAQVDAKLGTVSDTDLTDYYMGNL